MMSTIEDLKQDAATQLEAWGLAKQKMQVAVLLDVSRSMENSGFYSNGQVATLAKRLLALAGQLDDNGEVEVFPFGTKFYNPSTPNDNVTPIKIKLSEFTGSDARELALQNKLMEIYGRCEVASISGGTNYSDVLRASREYYFGEAEAPHTVTPVLRLFVTDGGCELSNQPAASEEFIKGSCLPIFDKIVAITTQGEKQFNFLSKEIDQGAILGDSSALPDYQKRCIDNADFKTVHKPDQIHFEMLIDEIAEWLNTAFSFGIISQDLVKIELEKFNAHVAKKRESERARASYFFGPTYTSEKQPHFFVRHKKKLALLAMLTGAAVGFGVGYFGVVAIVGSASALIIGVTTGGIGLAAAVGFILAITLAVWAWNNFISPKDQVAGQSYVPVAAQPQPGADFNRVVEQTPAVTREIQRRMGLHTQKVLKRRAPAPSAPAIAAFSGANPTGMGYIPLPGMGSSSGASSAQDSLAPPSYATVAGDQKNSVGGRGL